MLNKKVCEKCCSIYFHWETTIKDEEGYFKNNWENEMVHCHYLLNDYRTVGIKDKPPKKCPYILEQVINE